MKARSLDELSWRQTEQYLKDRAMVHLEAAIGSLLDSYPTLKVAEILKEQAEHLEQFG